MLDRERKREGKRVNERDRERESRDIFFFVEVIFI